MCAIFGILNVEKAAALTAIGLHNNQHRAIDYAGIVSSDRTGFHLKHGAGIARQVFSENVLANTLPGDSALGHLRYPTVSDDPARDNIQPVTGRYGTTPFALAHNGNITNVHELAEEISLARLMTSMDTEYIVRLLENRQSGDFEADLISVLRRLKGSFALAILLPDRLIAIRDPAGNRPLSVAKINGGYCISSESCAFPNLSAVDAFDVEPGTMVTIRADATTTQRFAPENRKQCRFEGIYYSHPASKVFGETVSAFRMKLGRALENNCPVKGGVDIVVPIPDSAVFIALGYAESGGSGNYFPAIVRSHYVGRTFIAPTQVRRDADVTQKFAFVAEEIRGRRIALVDDSIVRATTLPKIVAKLRELGAAEIHVRIGSPPIRHPCKYGINTPSIEELIAAQRSPEEICRFVGADTLAFLPLEVLRTLSPQPESFCFACMDGKYWD